MNGKANLGHFPPDRLLSGFWKRSLQLVALFAPGQTSLRILLHRWRGVKIGESVHIGPSVRIETSYPEWVSIGNNVTIGMRCMLIAHFELDPPTRAILPGHVALRIEDDAFVGPGCLILPKVTIGRGAVVAAGSVVTRSVPPLTMVQGNPARPVAECGIPLTFQTTMREFMKKIKPIRPARQGRFSATSESVSLDPTAIHGGK
jgi:acetyltransferase-like isoleucine patch superfamily enzyme